MVTNSSNRRQSLYALRLGAYALAAVVTLGQGSDPFEQPVIINATELLPETFHAVAE
jgi:hypothetical protein